MTARTKSLALLLALASATAAAAQDARPLAFTNARLVTVSGAVIERGTLVVRNGKIEALGENVTVPPGARVIDASGKTLLPGLVSAFSRAGLQGAPRAEEPMPGGRRRGNPMPMPSGGPGGGTANKAATKVVDGLYAKQAVFGDLLRLGVTSLALTPAGGGFPGLGAVLRPDGKTMEALTQDDDAFVQVTMVRDGATKKLLKETFEKAQKVVDERKRPPAPPTPPAESKPADKPPEPKPGDAKTEPPKGNEPPKPEPKPEEKKDGPPAGQNPQGPPQGRPQPQAQPKDPNLEVLADLLEGKRRAIVQIDSAADLLHWQQAVADGVKFPRALLVPRPDPLAGTIDVVLDQVKAMQCPVLLSPDLTTQARSRVLVHPGKLLHDAGIEVGFAFGDNPQTVRAVWFRLAELVRHGLPADVALRAVTLVPAKVLGIDKQVGSLEVGKDANLLVFTGDPLAANGQLETVWLAGREVEKQP